jgi:excisionase family DNA binding protein
MNNLNDEISLPDLCEPLLDYRSLARYIRISESALRCWVMQGRLPFFKIGKAVRFRRSEIDSWLTAHRVKPIGER